MTPEYHNLGESAIIADADSFEWDTTKELFKACRANSSFEVIAVRLRVKKKVQNLNAMWYKEFAKNFATQGDFGHESP